MITFTESKLMANRWIVKNGDEEIGAIQFGTRITGQDAGCQYATTRINATNEFYHTEFTNGPDEEELELIWNNATVESL